MDEEGSAVEGSEEELGAGTAEGESAGSAGVSGEGQGHDAGHAEDDVDEVVVTIGDASAPSEDEEGRAPQWVRELRKSNREKDRRIHDLEARLSVAQPANKTVVVGEKPKLEDVGYDTEKFEADLEAWHERKRQAETQAHEAQTKQLKEQEVWNARLEAYGRAKSALRVKDFDAAEEFVKDTLDVVQQGVVIAGADKSELVIYALYKNPGKARELAGIKDPVKFAFAIAKLETQLKVAPRKPSTSPERVVRGNVSGAAAVDDQLARLRAEAEKTGDLTKVIAYKTQIRNKQAA